MERLESSAKALYFKIGATSIFWLCVATFALFFLCHSIVRPNKLHNIPSVGIRQRSLFKVPSAPRKKFKDLLLEGYKLYGGHPFVIPSKRKSHVVVSGKFIEEIRKAPDDVLSLQENVNDTMMLRYTLGSPVADNPWHVNIVRKQLSHNLAQLFPSLHSEIAYAFQKEAEVGEEWKSLNAYDLNVRIVCRTSNRIFVGVPLCRNPDFLRLSKDFTLTFLAAGYIVGLFPGFLRRLASRLVTKAPQAVRQFQDFLVPMIKERNCLARQYGENGAEKPNDLLQWFIDNAIGEERDPKRITLRIATLNFAAIHTSSISFTHALYYLAANPHFILPLREEVDLAVQEKGWTKEAIDSMPCIDSFLKESQRLTGVNAESMSRKVLKPFTLSDGTTLPVGCHVCVNLYGTHRDDAIYKNAEVFEPFRFQKLARAGQDSARLQFTTGSPEYLVWGYGSHACPGRYFASMELKSMLAYVVRHYDVRFENDGVRPLDHWFGSACVPDMKAEVMFRKRV